MIKSLRVWGDMGMSTLTAEEGNKETPPPERKHQIPACESVPMVRVIDMTDTFMHGIGLEKNCFQMLSLLMRGIHRR